MLEFLAFLEAEGLHDLGHAVAGAEVAHELVLETDVETGHAGVALTGAASTELAVDATGGVALGAHDVEASSLPRRPRRV